eukprot:scaffold188243_cov41-Prasinocladus_malaysianus.AAC.1
MQVIGKVPWGPCTTVAHSDLSTRTGQVPTYQQIPCGIYGHHAIGQLRDQMQSVASVWDCLRQRWIVHDLCHVPELLEVLRDFTVRSGGALSSLPAQRGGD